MRNFALLPFCHGLSSKLSLLLTLVRIKLGIRKPYACALTLDCTHSLMVHLEGTRDELTILRDLFIGQEYAALKEVPVKNILDLGANIGLASAWFRLKYPNAAIHAYEPAPHAFALLQKNAESIGNIKLFAEAIGAYTGTATFHESKRSVGSSLVDSPALGESHPMSVPVVTIDTALERIGSADLMKVDIEGAEFDALAAATQLRKAAYIVGEAHPGAAKRSLDEIEQALSDTHATTLKRGDRLAGFYAVVR